MANPFKPLLMKKILAIVIVFMISLAASAQNQVWKVTNSKVTFKIKNAGLTVDGSFKGLEADIQFDPAKGFGNKIEASVDVKTINTSINARDNHLKKEEYFDVEKFPRITMKSSSFSKGDDGKFKGFFSVSIKGTTKTVPVMFSFAEVGGKATFSGTFKLNRLDYKVGESSWVMSDEVNITIVVEAVK
jgi:polyisoprenoid-binding protein YceI